MQEWVTKYFNGKPETASNITRKNVSDELIKQTSLAGLKTFSKAAGGQLRWTVGKVDYKFYVWGINDTLSHISQLFLIINLNKYHTFLNLDIVNK